MAVLKPLDPKAFDYWAAQHLLNRAGFGGPPAQVQELSRMGLDAAVDHLVDYGAVLPERLAAGRFDKDIMQPLPPRDRMAVREARQRGDEAMLAEFRQRRQEAQRTDRQQMRDVQRWWLNRILETPRPLEEKMTLFWHGHFATSYRGIEDSYHMFVQNELFRAHAAGNFKALTHAIIRDPAMLRYLNNDQNRKELPNENLARELMELFTLGEGHGYTEHDIKQGARALTGYTFHDDEFIGPPSRPYHRLHDDGAKAILGKVGNWNGDDFVDIIFSRRACSEFMCWKLYRQFVNDLPGEPDEPRRRYIVQLASALRDGRYELRPVLKAMFRSEHFYDPSNVGSMIKSPVQLIAQAVRALDLPARDPEVLLHAADLMGQNIFFPPSVKGWEGGRAWINTSTLFVRQNTMVFLMTGRHPERRRRRHDRARHERDGHGGAPYDAARLLDHLRRPDGTVDARDAATYLLRINLAGPPHPRRVDELAAFVQARGGRLDDAGVIAVLSLIMAMPEYQLC